MIKELVNFTEQLEEPFKILGYSPKEGLHIVVNKITDNQGYSKIDLQNYTYERYDKKMKAEDESEFLADCKMKQKNSWCVNTNKCFDLPTKAIHSCSPFCVAFKREHLKGGKKYKQYEGNKDQIYDRFNAYFEKAFSLFENETEKEEYKLFKQLFTHNDFTLILNEIDSKNAEQREKVHTEILKIQENIKSTSDKASKEKFKEKIRYLNYEELQFKELADSDYIIFYLNRPLSDYKNVHRNYLSDKLFNTSEYNTSKTNETSTYGTSDFLNGFPDKKPFSLHQTASFDIAGRISSEEAKTLYEFLNILPNRSLPNPLPIFIYEEELQKEAISLYEESGFKASYKEILKNLFRKYSQEEIANYYLLYWLFTKNGVIFKDFDFVSKFEFKLPDYCKIVNLLELKQKGSKQLKSYHLSDIFDFELIVFKPLIQNKYYRLDYFSDLKKDEYTGLDQSFSTFSKYRKAVYDYVYKAQRQAISYYAFREMVFARLKDLLKQDSDYGIKEILNIWFSLAEYFINPQKLKITMPSKLNSYHHFVEHLVTTEEKQTNEAITDEEFAFLSGQIIKYLHTKSKSSQSGFNLLEPYTQQSKCEQFKLRIANDFDRYKHQNFSGRFERAASYVLSYETSANLKDLLPEMLAGFFADNKLFSNSKNND
ncbi:hypothetical protein RM549_08015 [Salegentibacter sp. F188]|uniref:Uncharacterized protein n=1 Tax=Autumnicola patrickiae TaxID=3075591 RepID=A0ABU3E394_9FLAO|nr:hypothetical protein [Salegentibacter sp. F188]MDT0689727.1 hypothetical protein [Salegentibacter sp. F188]